jgi:hypothetical protein
MNMEKLHEHTDLLASARHYCELGLPIIALKGKIPAAEGWQQFEATPANVDYWFGKIQANIGLRTGIDSGYLVVDVDTPEAEEWVRTHLPMSPMRAISGAGSTHSYFGVPPRKEIRNKQAWKKIPGLDVRGSGGFIVLPPSIHPDTGKPYEWLTPMLRPQELPRFSPSWVYERRKKVVTAIVDTLDGNSMLHRGRLYVDRFEPAISNQGGHRATFIAALKIASFVKKDPDLAWALLCYFNSTKCEPEWSERELRHKWAESLKKAR